MAERVSAERCEVGGPGKRGSQVGYHVRLDAASTHSTRCVRCSYVRRG
jgi:HrpA-like RNA helicase